MANEGRIKQLQIEIELKRSEIEKLKKQPAAIINLEDYTTEEKVAFFDQLYKSSLRHLMEAEENSYVSNDSEHYMYEEMFTILNIKDKDALWEYYNTIIV